MKTKEFVKIQILHFTAFKNRLINNLNCFIQLMKVNYDINISYYDMLVHDVEIINRGMIFDIL